MIEENFESRQDDLPEDPIRINQRNNESENEDINNSEDDDNLSVQAFPISQSIMKDEPELKEFRSLEKNDKSKLKFSYLTKFFQKFSELKGRRKVEYVNFLLNL